MRPSLLFLCLWTRPSTAQVNDSNSSTRYGTSSNITLDETRATGNATENKEGPQSTATTTFTRPRGCEFEISPKRRNASLGPSWFFETVVWPFDRLQCQMPTKYFANLNNVNGTEQQYAVDKLTGQLATDGGKICQTYLHLVKYYFLLSFYEAFYGLALNPPSQYAPPLLFNQLLFYFVPICLLTSLLNLSVVRKLLKENSSSHIYYYHFVIIIADMTMYVVNALDAVGLFGVFLMPICFALMPRASSTFVDDYAKDAAILCVDLMYTISCQAQALMALDRMFALYHPLVYHIHATKSFVVKSLVLAIILNVPACILESLSTKSVAISISGSISENFVIVEQVRVYFRTVLLVAGLTVQIVSCSLVFAKMRRLAKQSQAKRGKAINQSLAPCYLLFGTCVLGFVGTTFAITSLVFRGQVLIQGRYNGFIVRSFNISTYYYKISTPICCSLGFLVHCGSSSQYRRLLAETKAVMFFRTTVLERIVGLFKRSSNVVAPVTEESGGTSSGMALSTFDTTGTTASSSSRMLSLAEDNSRFAEESAAPHR